MRLFTSRIFVKASTMFLLCFVSLAYANNPLYLYVSTNGSDAWTGTLAVQNAAGTDGPFASMDRARDEIRQLKSTAKLPAGGVVVIVRGGTYAPSTPFELTMEDSGTPESPILYTAYPGETVCLRGGRVVKDFQAVTDPQVLKQLNPAAREHVQVANLKASGVMDFGPVNGGLEVFFRNKPMTLSRWPNQGFTHIMDIAMDDGHKIHGRSGSKIGRFHYESRRPERWIGEKDPWAHGYWFWDWSDQRHPIVKIDAENRIIDLGEPYHGYGYRKGQWYYAYNMLCEIDQPGEWYVDREAGLLYFWPPAILEESDVLVSISPTIITMTGVSHVGLNGFTLEAARTTAVTIRGADHVIVADCVIRNVGGWGVEMSGKDSGVVNCNIYNAGRGGITLSGGDRKTLTPGGLYAVNNHIHHYARVHRMYQPGINIKGVGQQVANNLIEQAPHIGIQFTGNEHLMEFNEIHHVVLEANDAGAIYTGRNWTMRGNMIRHNYLHHIQGLGGGSCMGVYLDDMFSSADIVGNVFYKVRLAAFIGGGRDCTVENNIFVDCDPAMHVDARAMGWAGYHADEWIKEANEKGTHLGIAFKEPPYSTRYPELVTIIEDLPKAPKGNLITRNICVGGKWDSMEKKAKRFITVKDNFLGGDPLFVDREKLDFRLKADSPVFALGFKPIPIDKIGLNKVEQSYNDTPLRLRKDIVSK